MKIDPKLHRLTVYGFPYISPRPVLANRRHFRPRGIDGFLTLRTAKAMGFLGRSRPHPFLVRTTPKFRGVSSPRPIGLVCTPMGGAPVTSALGAQARNRFGDVDGAI